MDTPKSVLFPILCRFITLQGDTIVIGSIFTEQHRVLADRYYQWKHRGTSGSAYVSRQPWPACTSQKRFQPTGITTFGTGDCTRITTRFGSFDHVSRWFGPCYFPRTRAGTRTRASARTNGNGRRSFESYFGPIAVVPSGSPGSSTPT